MRKTMRRAAMAVAGATLATGFIAGPASAAIGDDSQDQTTSSETTQSATQRSTGNIGANVSPAVSVLGDAKGGDNNVGNNSAKQDATTEQVPSLSGLFK